MQKWDSRASVGCSLLLHSCAHDEEYQSLNRRHQFPLAPFQVLRHVLDHTLDLYHFELTVEKPASLMMVMMVMVVMMMMMVMIMVMMKVNVA